MENHHEKITFLLKDCFICLADINLGLYFYELSKFATFRSYSL